MYIDAFWSELGTIWLNVSIWLYVCVGLCINIYMRLSIGVDLFTIIYW